MRPSIVTVSSWDDLRRYGVDLLTGEACALGIRGLCDLTAWGRALVAEFFGCDESGFRSPWNGGSESDPHVASVMLPYQLLQPLAVLALYRDGYSVGLRADGSVVGWLADDAEACDRVRRYAELAAESESFAGYRMVRTFRPPAGQPVVGSRCVHAMSGRVV